MCIYIGIRRYKTGDRTLPKLSLLQEYQNFLWFPSPILGKMD